MKNKNNVPLGYSKPQTALGNPELTEEYGGISKSISVEDVEKAFRKVLEDHEKIPYTLEGLDTLLTEVNKLLPKRDFIIDIQPIEDLSAQDRAERKLPEITIRYDN